MVCLALPQCLLIAISHRLNIQAMRSTGESMDALTSDFSIKISSKEPFRERGVHVNKA